MSAIRIKGGRILDPANGVDRVGDLWLRNGKIVSAQEGKTSTRITTIEAKDQWVVPGLIDTQVHFREPGHEYKETIESGCAAAANGGFTSVVTMPNTDPVTDNRQVVEFILRKAEQANGVNVFPTGAITQGMKGEALSEIGEMKSAGIVAVTDDGKPLVNSAVMRSALEYCQNFDLVLMQHCEDPELFEGTHAHEGYNATRLGIPGAPAIAETIMAVRDMYLAEYVGARYHVLHASAAETVEAIARFKERGAKITCEVTPHHFTLTDSYLETYDSNYKMNPPLRSERHVEALKKALKDGVIDCISTDHAPHSLVEKQMEFDQSSFGIIGLETALPLSLNLVREGLLEPMNLIEKMTINPARVIGVDRGTLSQGAVADVTVINPDLEWTYDVDQIKSRSQNSPFLGWTLHGRATHTISAGKIIHKLES